MSQPHLALYCAPMACSLVPWLLLTEAGAVFETRPVNLRKREHLTPEFLRVNPKHRLPVLLIDGQALSKNVAIQLWIARQFPAAGLMPEEPLAFARATALLAWCASAIHPTLTPNALPERYCDLPDSADSVRRCAQRLLLEHLAIADEQLTGRDWFFEHFTSAHAYLFWCLRRARQFGVDASALRHAMAHFERMQQRPSVIALQRLEADVMARFAAA